MRGLGSCLRRGHSSSLGHSSSPAKRGPPHPDTAANPAPAQSGMARGTAATAAVKHLDGGFLRPPRGSWGSGGAQLPFPSQLPRKLQWSQSRARGTPVP